MDAPRSSGTFLARTMWSFFLLLGLLCSSSHGSVTCRDENDGEVDWYILYKAPKTGEKNIPARSGLEYIYIDSKGEKQFDKINNPKGVLALTLQPLFKSIKDMEESFGFISYSDQPPGSNANSDRFGHSKGVLMVNRTGTGLWLSHSTPQFPFRRDQNHFWPQSGNVNAQIFICVTFDYNEFKKIGKHLQQIRAFPFEHYVPEDFHQDLQDVVKWTQQGPSIRNIVHFASLESKGKSTFKSFAKKTSSVENDGDLYVNIASDIKSHVYAQTWGCQPDRSASYCPPVGYNVTNVEDVTVNVPSGNLWTWKPSKDHSKWCVAVDQNRNWTCIGDMNRAVTQSERYGGALCIHDGRIKEIFLGFAGNHNTCQTVVENAVIPRKRSRSGDCKQGDVSTTRG